MSSRPVVRPSMSVESIDAKDPEVQRDDVYVGDTLVMKLINLDEEHRITLDSEKFEILPAASAA